MNPLHFVVDAFVNTFGITRPSARQEAAAGRYIALMLVGVATLLAVAAWAIRAALTH
jgi:hypothetical protein